MNKTWIALIALALALTMVAPALAENPAGPPAPDRQEEAKNLRKEIVRLKYVRAQDIQSFLYTYISRDGRIMVNNNMPSVLTISDTPENVEKILAAIREIDVKPADVLYTVQLVLGSDTDAATDPELKNDPIIKELGKLLRYKGYTLLDATFVRTVNTDNASVKFGPKAEFQLELRPEVAGDAKAPVIKTGVRLTRIEQHGFSEDKPITSYTRLIDSTLNVKSGDRTVVGVSKLDGGDKGLILIISGKVVD
ncbi:MAG: hypothetical protein JW775_01725 [Candidatus Aminicenantes bacterium]|nr:hypothetical protein [Candidatus Aminicenantes bacterium]